MLDAIGRIERYVAGVRKEDFFADDSMVAAAVVRELEIIGEAGVASAKRISRSICIYSVARNYRYEKPSHPWVLFCRL